LVGSPLTTNSWLLPPFLLRDCIAVAMSVIVFSF
jgi:hypothetical protein